MNRENLQKLADYLRGPEIAMRFDMGSYCRNSAEKQDIHDGDPLNPAEHSCGTVGCALGHGPASGVDPDKSETWDRYSDRAFGLEPWGRDWEWCFGPIWAETDNTPKGAAARIQYLLDYGLPRNWMDQMRGDEPLCYRAVTP